MQTFLPYADFEKSAKCLDMRRLGKQRVECLQILTALKTPEYGWQNHPAVKMWRGYTGALICYSRAICYEWRSRGYKDTCLEKINNLGLPFGEMPKFIGDEKFHASHRSNLLRKNSAWYSKFHWFEPADLPYIWPVVV